MRNKLWIGAFVGLLGVAVAIPTVSVATDPVQTLTVNSAPSKQKKKKRGGVRITVAVDTDYTTGDLIPPGSATCNGTTDFSTCKYFPPATRTVLDFDNAYRFVPGKIPSCNAALGSLTTSQAKAACPKSIVGAGSSVVKTVTNVTLNGVVTAFVGPKAGNGVKTLRLHVDIPAVANKPVLIGTLVKSPAGSDYGQRLDVDVPVTPGSAITHFDTTINRRVSKRKVVRYRKRIRRGGRFVFVRRKRVIKTFFASANCSDRNRKLNVKETTYFVDYGENPVENHSASSVQRCTVRR